MDRREYLFSKCSLAKLSIRYALPHPKIYTKYGPSPKTPNEKTFGQFRDFENRPRWSKNLKKHHPLWLIWNWKCEKRLEYIFYPLIFLHTLWECQNTGLFAIPLQKRPITPINRLISNGFAFFFILQLHISQNIYSLWFIKSIVT